MKARHYLSILAFFLLPMLGVACSHSPQQTEPSAVSADTSALHAWKAGVVVTTSAVSAYGEGRCFRAEPLSDAVFARMKGKSYKENPYIRRSDLRYVRALHYDGEGRIRIGEMVCHKDIAADLVSIFRELYRNRYAIERMVLIDNYDADDEQSMRANNSSCFCYRAVKGSKHLSLHSQGRAVDINTLYNPCVRTRKDGTRSVQPTTGAQYVNRNAQFPYKIDRNDLCYRLFLRHGFTWGGAWRTVKDYQHFEKKPKP